MKESLKFIRSIFSNIICWIDARFVRWHIITPRVVRYIDGGICSQMHMYITGESYKRRGFDVYYDLDWFEYFGKDMNGKAQRDYELQEMFPQLEVMTLSKFQTWFYKSFMSYRPLNDLGPTPEMIKHSIYLKGYLGVKWEAWENPYKTYFTLSTMNAPKKLKYSKYTYCGIHVRRGDLANVNLPYYGIISDGYFFRAIDYVQANYKDVKFLFFSDELEWVEQNITPYIHAPFELMKGNKAYEDLGLLAQCRIIVASQGSFGKVAARINPNATLIMCDNEYANRTRPNTILIS